MSDRVLISYFLVSWINFLIHETRKYEKEKMRFVGLIDVDKY